MKILMLTSYLPYPPTSGGQVRSYNLIKNLAKKHEITLFSLIKNDSEKKFIKELGKYCRKVAVFNRSQKPWTLENILKTGFSRHPFLVIRNFSIQEKVAVEKELKKERYDLIHAENFYVMPHIPPTKIPILLTEQTILYRVYQHFVETLPWYLFWLKPVLMIDVWKLRNEETFYWQSADYLAAVSKEDRNHISSLVSGKKVGVVPNGVDYQYYAQKKYPKDRLPTILFGAADFHWMQNKEGAEILLKKIWPLIMTKLPEARLWIVGKIAPEALAEYQKQKNVIIQEIEDNREAYQRAWVLLAPMKSGGGSRTKFFEAMASGLPIVTTPEGIEGIPAINRKEAIIDNDFDRLAGTTIEVLKNPELAEEIGQNGKKLVEDQYDWSVSALELEKIYKLIRKIDD